MRAADLGTRRVFLALGSLHRGRRRLSLYVLVGDARRRGSAKRCCARRLEQFEWCQAFGASVAKTVAERVWTEELRTPDRATLL
jgi:hypothetical protein